MSHIYCFINVCGLSMKLDAILKKATRGVIGCRFKL